MKCYNIETMKTDSLHYIFSRIKINKNHRFKKLDGGRLKRCKALEFTTLWQEELY